MAKGKREITFFPSEYANQEALLNGNLKQYPLPKINELVDILEKLLGSLEISQLQLNVEEYIHSVAKNWSDKKIPELLAEKIIENEEFSEEINLPVDKHSLNIKLNSFVALLLDVLNNQLAQNCYEELFLQENVSEREHALQAGKIAHALGMPLCYVLGMLFHDVARVTNHSEHGHQFHTFEGFIILQSLGMEVAIFCLLHAFAKEANILKVKNYKEQMVSPVSLHSLTIQNQQWHKLKEILGLLPLTLEEKIKAIILSMFLRMLDEFAKIPQCNKALYFSDALIEKMIRRQLMLYLKQEQEKDIELTHFEQELDESLEILLRAKDYSIKNREIYTSCEEILREDKERSLFMSN